MKYLKLFEKWNSYFNTDGRLGQFAIGLKEYMEKKGFIVLDNPNDEVLDQKNISISFDDSDNELCVNWKNDSSEAFEGIAEYFDQNKSEISRSEIIRGGNNTTILFGVR